MAARRILALAGACTLQGCIVSTVVGTAVDVGVEVVKVPFKVGKAVIDAGSDDKDKKNQESTDKAKDDAASTTSPPAKANQHP